VSAIAPSFGPVLLTDISAPRCFEIELKLRARSNLPVMHVEQHATAVVTLAALLNAARQTGETLDKLTVGVVGLGSAGSGIARLLQSHGVKQLLGGDLLFISINSPCLHPSPSRAVTSTQPPPNAAMISSAARLAATHVTSIRSGPSQVGICKSTCVPRGGRSEGVGLRLQARDA
jgi:malic enzyme